VPKQNWKEWWEERLGLESIFSFLRHKEVPRHKHTLWYYTGSAILVFFVIQVLTGFLLLLYYKYSAPYQRGALRLVNPLDSSLVSNDDDCLCFHSPDEYLVA